MIDLKSKTILVLDDDPTLRTVMSQHLQLCGAAVLQESDGTRGFAILPSAPIDLVISDIRMPGMGADGITFLKRVQSELSSPPPIILVSGFSDIEGVEAIKLGARAFIAKPYSMKLLDAAILEALSNGPKQA